MALRSNSSKHNIVYIVGYHLVRMYMDVNEHETLSNITVRHTLRYNKGRSFTLHLNFSHSNVFNNEHNLYPKINGSLQ